MPKVDASEFADKWARRTKGATADLKRGIEKTTVSPSQEAIKKEQKMKTNLMEAIESGKWKRGLEGYSLEDWKADMTSKGIGRVAGGVDSAQASQQEFAQKLLAFEADVQSKMAKMPDLTLEDSIQRSNFWIREMAKFRK